LCFVFNFGNFRDFTAVKDFSKALKIGFISFDLSSLEKLAFCKAIQIKREKPLL